ncbi:MAG: FAD-binding oxidoreductase [Salinibacter sp.]|uniref:FAD-binding oxidoreductase n=1 Tax=Salinibacter sp. TaxID=2065818 RepID=UPI002FC3A166
MDTLQATTLTNGQTTLSEEAIDEFAGRLRGPLITPGDDGYDAARQVWNGMIDKRPALIARCSGTADVIDAVNFARENDLLLAVRGGGHNVAGDAVCDGGLVIDLSEMRGVRVDPSAQTVRAEGGATWGDLDRETQAFGLVTPGGVVSTTGIAGLTLGGGLGWLRCKHGLSCDNLISADVVTADGELLPVSEDENPDLFWGLRGGGGNFGVVTSFEFELHEVGPTVMMCAVMYPAETAPEALPAWRDFMEAAPDEVSSQAYFWAVPDVEAFPAEARGENTFIVAAMHAGPPDEGERVLQPLRELGTPLVDLSGPMPYRAVQTLFDPFFPEGERHYYFKSRDLASLDDEVIDAIIDGAMDRPVPTILIAIWHYGGAMSRVGADETAFGSRDAPYLFSVDATWDDPADSERVIEWSRAFLDYMEPYAEDGMYVNFSGFGEEGDKLVRSAYGPNYERLARLKAEYDPDNLFRLNQNIRPAGGASDERRPEAA